MKIIFKLILGAIILLVLFNVIIPSSSELTEVESIARSHQEYSRRDQGYQSSFLPRVGTTRGDDYRNCIERNFNGPYDAHDFCAWHAGIGPYQ